MRGPNTPLLRGFDVVIVTLSLLLLLLDADRNANFVQTVMPILSNRDVDRMDQPTLDRQLRGLNDGHFGSTQTRTGSCVPLWIDRDVDRTISKNTGMLPDDHFWWMRVAHYNVPL